MASRKPRRIFRFLQIALLFIVAGGYWYYENIYQEKGVSSSASSTDAAGADQIDARDQIKIGSTGSSEDTSPEKTASLRPPTLPAAKSAPAPAAAKPPAQASTKTPAKNAKPTTEKVGSYDRLVGTVMIDHRNNDGDSFFVRHGDREFELRLYYADSPEKYLSDRYEDQRRRVAEQAREMGNLSLDETIAVGLAAKAHVAKALKGQSFSVFTKWERVYDGERYYGFVLLPDETEWLSEDLVENGLARIHTKGESTPDGKSYRDYKKHLETLEKQAQKAKVGAWK